jgi:hypothetical protein
VHAYHDTWVREGGDHDLAGGGQVQHNTMLSVQHNVTHVYLLARFHHLGRRRRYVLSAGPVSHEDTTLF